MQTNHQKPGITPSAHLAYTDVCSQNIPWPAFERGWLHGRVCTGPWDLPRLAEKMGDALWMSHYSFDDGEPDTADLRRAKPRVFAGFGPTGGFIDVRPCRSSVVEDPPRSSLCVHAASTLQAMQVLEDLRKEYFVTSIPPATGPRIALLNVSYSSLEVHRVNISENQLVAPENFDLFYGDGALAWANAWVAKLQERRYGLSLLCGAPGTGKTTLLRSLSAWLGESHLFYYMPATRFGSVDSGEVVTFWAGENRASKLRKVLVLEDADTILLHRNSENRDQVATLLNLTDGILGDALGLQIVCTMNGTANDIDPALLRPGRLMAHREFKPLTGAAAHRLASFLGKPNLGSDGITLAQIFDTSPQQKSVPTLATRPKIGFFAADHLE